MSTKTILLRNRHSGLLAEPSTLKKIATDYFAADPQRTILVNPQRVIDPADISLQRTLVRQNHRTEIYFLKNKSTAPLRTCGGSVANPRRNFGSAADFGGVRSRSARVRAKSIPGKSTRGLPEVRADTSRSAAEPKRTRVRPFNSQNPVQRKLTFLYAIYNFGPQNDLIKNNKRSN